MSPFHRFGLADVATTFRYYHSVQKNDIPGVRFIHRNNYDIRVGNHLGVPRTYQNSMNHDVLSSCGPLFLANARPSEDVNDRGSRAVLNL